VNQEGRKGGKQETTRRAALEFLLSFLPAFLSFFLDQLQASLRRCGAGSIRFNSCNKSFQRFRAAIRSIQNQLEIEIPNLANPHSR